MASGRAASSGTAALLAPTDSTVSDPATSVAASVSGGVLAGARRLPLLFTHRDTLSPGTEQYLRRSAIKRIVVVGAPDAVADTVLQQLAGLGIQSSRLAGADRFATAVAVAAETGFARADDASVILLVDGSPAIAWPGGYIAPLFAARWHAPVLFSDGDGLPPPTHAYLAESQAPHATVLVCMPGVTQTACSAGKQLLRPG
jgi:ell wall binding domain 2 (CWB2)